MDAGHDTAMHAAFAKVGVTEDAEARLLRAAREAIEAADGRFEEALGALVVAASHDIGVLWEMTKDHHFPAAARALRRVAELDRKAKPVASTGLWAPTDRSRGGHAGFGTHGGNASPHPHTRPLTAAAIEGRAALALGSILDTHRTELDKPVGDCTRAELDALAQRSTRKARFYAALANGLPPDGRVRDFVKPEEAETAWKASFHD